MESGWLKKAFMGAVKLATVGLVAAVAWQIFLDPLFFPIIHDTTNVFAQAWMMKINSMFSWIPQHVGLAKTPGLLTPVMERFLSDEISLLRLPTVEDVAKIAAPGMDFSLDSL